MNKNLIYDVGMHKGEDTSYYLKKGFKVVAFEADPDLISMNKENFSKEIKDGDLIIVEGAIIDKSKTSAKKIKFYKNQSNTVWGTVVEEWSIRNEQMGSKSIIIEVPTVDFGKCIEVHGMPYYLKIDVEGMDVVCLESLVQFESKPAHISIESEKVDFAQLIKEFELFEALGYDNYQMINQENINLLKEPADSREGKFLNYTFKKGSSGLFGSDFRTPWLSKKKALRNYKWIFYGYKLWGDNSRIKYWFGMNFIKRILRKLLRHNIPGWYDTHARHSSSIQETKHNNVYKK